MNRNIECGIPDDQLLARKVVYEMMSMRKGDSHRPGSAEEYTRVFNLTDEIAELPPESTVLDLGCGQPEERLKKLAAQYPNVRFVGVDFRAKTRKLSPSQYVIKGLGEEINTNVKRKLERRGLWPPKLILLFNVLEDIHQANLNRGIKDILEELFNALPVGGSVFSYESRSYYRHPEIKRMADEIGLSGFEISSRPVQGAVASPGECCVRLFKSPFLNYQPSSK